MQPITQVLFDRQERATLKLAALSAPIAYQRGGDDDDALRLLNGVAQRGDVISRSRLQRAHAAYVALLKGLLRESQEAYWDAVAPATGDDSHLPEPMRRAMMVKVLTETRQRQAGEVTDALDLLAEAILVATEPQDDPETGRTD